MKTPRILLLGLALLSGASAIATAQPVEFTLRSDEVPALITALAQLDGYEKSVDQGPANNPRVITVPFTFARETRAKLGANRAALIKAWRDLQEKLGDIRLSISGDADRIDEKDAAQIKEWRARTKPLEQLTVQLSPITTDELTANDNPIPISTLSVLNLLRPKK